MRYIYSPEHQIYTYDDSESPRGSAQASRPHPSSPDAVSLLDESPQRPSQRGALRTRGDAEVRAKAPDDKEEQDQLKLSRCLSDPGPKKDEEDDGSFLSWWSTFTGLDSRGRILLLTIYSCYQWWSLNEWVIAKLDIYNSVLFFMFLWYGIMQIVFPLLWMCIHHIIWFYHTYYQSMRHWPFAVSVSCDWNEPHVHSLYLNMQTCIILYKKNRALDLPNLKHQMGGVYPFKAQTKVRHKVEPDQ